MSVVDRSTQPSAVAGYRRLHLVERAAPPAGGITRALQVVLVLAGVVLLIAGAAAFVGVVQQGALDAPAPLALGRARSAMAPSTGWLASAALLPIGAVLSFVAYAALGLRRAS